MGKAVPDGCMGPFILAKMPCDPKCGQWDPRPLIPFYNLIRKFVYNYVVNIIYSLHSACVCPVGTVYFSIISKHSVTTGVLYTLVGLTEWNHLTSKLAVCTRTSDPGS